MLPDLIKKAQNIEERESLLKVRISPKEKLMLEDYAKKS
jgi:hypothetical protein